MQSKQEGQTTKHLINNYVTFKKKKGLTSTARLINTLLQFNCKQRKPNYKTNYQPYNRGKNIAVIALMVSKTNNNKK